MPDRRKKTPWPAIIRGGRPEAPALAEWILRVSEYAEGQSLVPRIAAVARVSEPTVRAGGPVEPGKRVQFVERLEASLLRTVARCANEAVDIAAHMRSATYPTAFAAFAGGYNATLLELCDAMDRISEAVATRQWTWSRGAQGVVEIGRLSAARDVPTLPPAPDDLVALDATLLVLAQLDMQVLLDHHAPSYPVQSLFLRVSPQRRDGTVVRWPYARLLDRMYVMACVRDGRSLEASLPDIARLDAILGTTPAHGTKSRVGHWRTGRAMRRSDFDDIAARRLGDGIERFAADKLYIGATFWYALMKDAPEQIDWALDRFSMWWSLVRPVDFVDGHRPPDPLNELA